MHRIGARLGLIAAALLVSVASIRAQDLDPAAAQQISDVLRLKASYTPAQQKISSDLIFGAMGARSQALPSVPQKFFRNNMYTDVQGRVLIDIRTNALAPVLSRVHLLGGQIISSSAQYNSVRANMPLLQVEALAEEPGVRWIRRADQAATNSMGLPGRSSLRISPFIGSVTTQGYISHEANKVVQMQINGSGVNVGVISDSASPARVAALIASGDLPADTVVLPGQSGAPGTDEGTAMMEIVHDMAPAAKLFFTTGFGGQSVFAENIRNLRFKYHCDIIVDDVSYSDELVYQDGTVAQAVNDVVANGAVYFSSAANSGNLSHKTSGTWEGDFKDGGDAAKYIDGLLGESVRVHNFAAAGSKLYNTITAVGQDYVLEWSDPGDHSSNDYDIFDFDSTGATLKGAGTSAQTGTQDPVETINFPDCDSANPNPDSCPAIGDRIIIVKAANAAKRALHLDTQRGKLAIATNGATFGHNAGQNTVSIAATYWNSARSGLEPFTGFANPTETFSSDGPRKIFYHPNGTPITPNNFLFATEGGLTLQKPDLTAADGNFSATPRFTPFYGTSSAAPHAAGIAALVKSANPKLTNAQIRSVMIRTALDTMAPGPDRDAGYGIAMALQSVEAAIGQ